MASPLAISPGFLLGLENLRAIYVVLKKKLLSTSTKKMKDGSTQSDLFNKIVTAMTLVILV